MAKKFTYDEALSEIEQIVSNIEENKYSIDELAEKVKRISFLVNYCKEKLRNTEDELNKILKEEK
jgi:exodeoxyribonuclease VII small subunit